MGEVFPLSDWAEILIIRRFYHACRFAARVNWHFQLLTYHYIGWATLVLNREIVLCGACIKWMWINTLTVVNVFTYLILRAFSHEWTIIGCKVQAQVVLQLFKFSFFHTWISTYVFCGDCIKSGPTDYERFNCHFNIFDVNVLFQQFCMNWFIDCKSTILSTVITISSSTLESRVRVTYFNTKFNFHFSNVTQQVLAHFALKWGRKMWHVNGRWHPPWLQILVFKFVGPVQDD